MADTLTLAAFAADPEKYFLIDVRSPQDHAAAHVDGAANIPLDELQARLAEIPDDRIPVAVCNWGGGRSAEGAALLRRLGHGEAMQLEGGTQGWLAEGNATDAGE